VGHIVMTVLTIVLILSRIGTQPPKPGWSCAEAARAMTWTSSLTPPPPADRLPLLRIGTSAPGRPVGPSAHAFAERADQAGRRLGSCQRSEATRSAARCGSSGRMLMCP
jgi:hypothetical protein